jgi:hypothetical protein
MDHFAQLKAHILSLRAQASSYDKLRMSYWLLSKDLLRRQNQKFSMEELAS